MNTQNTTNRRRRRRRTSSDDISSVISNIEPPTKTDGKRRRRRTSPMVSPRGIDSIPSDTERPEQEIDQVVPEEVETEIPVSTSDEGINDINKIRREFLQEAYSPQADPSYSDEVHDWASESEEASADY